MRRGGPSAELLRGQRHEVVEADRLVVGDVVDRTRRARARPPERSADATSSTCTTSHRFSPLPITAKRPGWRRCAISSFSVPAARARTRAKGESRRPAAPSSRTRRSPSCLERPYGVSTGSGSCSVSSASVSVAGDDRRGEHDPRPGRRVCARELDARAQQSLRARDVDLLELALAALGGDLGRQVKHAVRARVEHGARQRRPVAELGAAARASRRAPIPGGARAPRPRVRARAAARTARRR